jgi:hypothetical protein
MVARCVFNEVIVCPEERVHRIVSPSTLLIAIQRRGTVMFVVDTNQLEIQQKLSIVTIETTGKMEGTVLNYW